MQHVRILFAEWVTRTAHEFIRENSPELDRQVNDGEREKSLLMAVDWGSIEEEREEKNIAERLFLGCDQPKIVAAKTETRH